MRSAILSAVVLLGACTASAGQGEASGASAQREFEVGGFDRVMLAGSQNVIVNVGAAPSVRAEGDAEAIERLEIEVVDGRLRIGSRRNSSWNWTGGRRRAVTVYVTVPALTGASVAGSGDMRVDRVEGPSFDASVAGSGDLQLEAVQVQQARFSVSGSGNLRAAGAAGRTEVSVAGSGNVDLAAVDSRETEVRVMGSGDARVRATQTASATVRGSGDITVTGGARCSVSKRGSGDVHCG